MLLLFFYVGCGLGGNFLFYLPTGELTQGELYSAIKKEEEQSEAGDVSTTHFSGEMHFYELVEDTKDGIWLVQVKALNDSLLKGILWKNFPFQCVCTHIGVS